jgi:hypothetical protein
MSDYVLGSLPAYLMVEVPKLCSGTGLDLLLGCYQLAILAGSVLAVGQFALDLSHRFVPLPFYRTGLSPVDDGDINGLVIYPGSQGHRVDDALINSSCGIT